MQILVADDSPVSRSPLETTLRKWGYDVISVADGMEAWEILQSESAPRIAIVDWMMPGLSGPELCQLVRRRQIGYYTYILMLTSRNDREDLITGMEAGADDYIVKPPDLRELRARLGPARRIVELESELSRIREDLRVQATRDSLTGLWNRNAIFEILDREVARCEREGVPLGVLLGDLDFFKEVNDTHGHLVGDTVLREAAHRMVRSVRPYDAVGRYGGEEFLVILPGCDIATAERKAETIRRAIEASAIQAEHTAIRVTTSFGATSIPGGTKTPSHRLVQMADLALYQAKHRGRNRVVPLPWS